MELSRVWHITREYRGLAEAGGIKDVVRDLSESLAGRGLGVTVVLPYYGFMKNLPLSDTGTGFRVSLSDSSTGSEGEDVQVFIGKISGVRIYCLKAKRFQEKSGVYTYTREDVRKNPDLVHGTGHSDAMLLGILFQKSVIHLMKVLGAPPSIVHCHDAHTALIPAMMKGLPGNRDFFHGTGTIVTIHNAGPGYQQIIQDPEFVSATTGLSPEILSHGILKKKLYPFLLASRFALLNTVSQNYAEEILGEKREEVSEGLGRALRKQGVELTGIMNGINPAHMDPRTPALTGIPSGFDPGVGDLAGKQECRESLLAAIRKRSLPDSLSIHGTLRELPGAALYTFQARITEQKGVSVLLGAAEQVLRRSGKAMFLLLGQGDHLLEEKLVRFAESPQAAGRFCFLCGYDEEFAKLLFSSGDFFLIPSLFEPCGITDLFSRMMGTIPIVHYVGGLVKITENETGYTYTGNSSRALAKAIGRSYNDFMTDKDKIERLIRNGFHDVLENYIWNKLLDTGYLPLYRKSLNHPVVR